ncbi:MAG: hypothetical protein HOW73_07650 [Polyangiaceae bacterium]|nr:hypothetical protein [Polyangiaceae bacterium]
MARPSLIASAALGWAAVIVLHTGGCSIAFDLDQEQCESNADCVDKGFADAECRNKVCVEPANTGGSNPGGGGEGGQGGSEPPLPSNFTCLDNFVPATPGATIHYNYRFELATAEPGTPPMNTTVKLCRSLAPTCTNPEETFTPDAEGVIEFDLEPDFPGFLELVSDPKAPIMPTIVYFEKQPIVIPGKQIVVRVIDPESFNSIAEFAGVPIDPSRGTSILLSIDCNDERTSGVTFVSDQVDEDTTPYHFKGSLPSPTATETDEQAAGGFVNMPPGSFTARATVASSGRFIGEATFLSRAGYLTYVPMGPTTE